MSERERAHWAILYLSKDATLTFPSPALLAPQTPRDPPDLSRDNTSNTSAQTLTHKCAHIFFSLFTCLSYLTPLPHTIAYLPIPRERHEYGGGNPRSTCRLTFSAGVVPEMWQGWSPRLRLFIYAWISGF